MRRSGVLIVVLLAPGCLFGRDEADERSDELRAARIRWEASGVTDYTVREFVSCFCLCPHGFTIVVDDEALTDVTDIEPIEGLPPEDLEGVARSCARTVPQLFDLIAAHVEDADRFHVEYDASLGYPTRISIDPESRIADEEINVALVDREVAGAPRGPS